MFKPLFVLCLFFLTLNLSAQETQIKAWKFRTTQIFTKQKVNSDWSAWEESKNSEGVLLVVDLPGLKISVYDEIQKHYSLIKIHPKIDGDKTSVSIIEAIDELNKQVQFRMIFKNGETSPVIFQDYSNYSICYVLKRE